METPGDGEAGFAAEARFFGEILAGKQRYFLAQGLPKYYFRHFRELFPATGDGKSLGHPPLFITNAMSAVIDLSELGAEIYVLKSIPDLDREHEIAAFEEAHKRLGESMASMSPAAVDLAMLTVDDDLPILAQSLLYPRIESLLVERFGDRKIILPMQNNDDSYRLMETLGSFRFGQVRGEFEEVLFPPPLTSMEEAASRPLGRGGTTAGELLDQLDRQAREAAARDEKMAPWRALRPANPVLVSFHYPTPHFSFDILLSVCQQLRAGGRLPIFLPKDDETAREVRKQGFLVLDPREISPPPGLGQLKTMIESMDFPVWPYTGFSRLEGWRKRLFGQVRQYAIFSKLIQALRPNSLLTYPYGARMARALRLAAHRHGALSTAPLLLGVAGHARGFPVMDDFTVFLSYGDEAMEKMVEFGVAEKQLLLTGNPRYDTIPTHKAQAPEYRKEFLANMPPVTPIALVATTGLLELDRLWLDHACRSAAALGMLLVIKPHPSSGCAPYAPWTLPPHGAVCWQGDLNHIAAACDVLITDYSSTGWEAVLYNKPMIVVNFSGQEFSYRWEDEGVGVRVSTADQLHAQLQAVATGRFSQEILENQRKSVRRFNHENDGLAAKRVAEFLGRRRLPLWRFYWGLAWERLVDAHYQRKDKRKPKRK